MSRAPMHRVSRLVCATALVTTFTGGFCACSTAADPPDDTSGSDLARKRRDAGAHGDAHEASAGDATAPDAGGGCDSASGCAIDPAPPRLIAPLSVTHATSRQPALHFVLGRDSDAATIDLCLDPRCTEVVATLEGTGLVVPPTPLRPGPIFWRGRGVRRGNVVGSTYSPTWVVNISHGSTTVDTSWGHAPDIDATGIASIVTTAQAYTNGHTEIWAFSPPDRSRPL